MKKFFALSFALIICVSFSGCGQQGGTAVENAELSAIEAYQAAEAAEQASLQTEMSEGLETEQAQAQAQAQAPE